jgi:hypothetical protein
MSFHPYAQKQLAIINNFKKVGLRSHPKTWKFRTALRDVFIFVWEETYEVLDSRIASLGLFLYFFFVPFLCGVDLVFVGC